MICGDPGKTQSEDRTSTSAGLIYLPRPVTRLVLFPYQLLPSYSDLIQFFVIRLIQNIRLAS